MPQPANTALRMDDNCQLSVQRNLPVPTPEHDELLVKVLFSGVNPADIKHGTQWGVRPIVLGYDFSGEVVSAPPGSGFKPGELVAGMTPTGLGRPFRFGAHQNYLACPTDLAFLVPSNLPMQDAACLKCVAGTAADAVFNIFRLSLPDAGAAASEDKDHASLLVWGASTAVGSCAIQFARACGINSILATASPARHEMLRSIGATHCFDYRDPEVEAKIASAVKGQGLAPVRYALDAAGSPKTAEAPSSAERMIRCASKDAVVVSVIPHGPGIEMPLADRSRAVTIRLAQVPEPVTIPPEEEKAKRMLQAQSWAVKNYGSEFVLPLVEVFTGPPENALKEIRLVASQGKFGKLAIQHPF